MHLCLTKNPTGGLASSESINQRLHICLFIEQLSSLGGNTPQSSGFLMSTEKRFFAHTHRDVLKITTPNNATPIWKQCWKKTYTKTYYDGGSTVMMCWWTVSGFMMKFDWWFIFRKHASFINFSSSKKFLKYTDQLDFNDDIYRYWCCCLLSLLSDDDWSKTNYVLHIIPVDDWGLCSLSQSKWDVGPLKKKVTQIVFWCVMTVELFVKRMKRIPFRQVLQYNFFQNI